MPTQDHFWSAAASVYEKEFIDPQRAGGLAPLHARLLELTQSGARSVTDLGCGIGPLLPFLAQHFSTVVGVDFAPGMLERARQTCGALKNVTIQMLPFTDLAPLQGQFDVGVAVNSLILPDIRALEASLNQVRACLKPGGSLLAVIPAMDAVHYCAMLLLDRALASGKPMEAARKNAAHHGEHTLYDFAFGQFKYRGLEQHFWQPFEIEYRLHRAGFRAVRWSRLPLSWEQHACGGEFAHLPPPWDFLVEAEAPR